MELASLEVLVVDCQATRAGEAGQLLELGWARSGDAAARARLIRPPGGARVPPAVARVTGISDRLLAGGVPEAQAWAELVRDAAALGAPAPAVAHFARFERPFLERLSAGCAVLEVVCTHEIARRLFPELPRRSLRALTGYFGRAVPSLRRSAEHVEATGFLWRQLVGLLAEEGVSTWPGLRAWLEQPVEPGRRARHAFPMPRELRLAAPHAPGLYRMLRTGGDVLYVGKATSLHHRVNSYFRKQHGVHERTLEMLSQARGLSFEVTESALEAALLEPDEIKRHRPPYNVQLTEADRAAWFCAPDFTGVRPRASPQARVGPFPSQPLLDQVAAFAAGSRAALGPERWGPPAAVFAEGHARLIATHGEARPLRLGTRLWLAGRRVGDDRDEVLEPRREWTAELVFTSLEELALRAALAVRRARWLTRLTDASLVWSEGGAPRLLLVEAGELAHRGAAPAGEPPVPRGHQRSAAERREGFTLARFDRLRVLTTELKRLVTEQRAAALRLGPAPAFTGPSLARILEWL